MTKEEMQLFLIPMESVIGLAEVQVATMKMVLGRFKNTESICRMVANSVRGTVVGADLEDLGQLLDEYQKSMDESDKQLLDAFARTEMINDHGRAALEQLKAAFGDAGATGA